MTEESAPFAALLRQYRAEAELTQEALAEHADLSPRSIQKLERGESLPYPITVQRLARALRLTAEQRAQFQAAAARGSKRPEGPPSLVGEGTGGAGGEFPGATVTYLLLAVEDASQTEPPDAVAAWIARLDDSLGRALEGHGGTLL